MKRLLPFFMAVFMMFGTVSASIAADNAEITSTVPPIVIAVTENSVVLAPIIGYEYKMGDGEWQTRNLFMGLEPLTKYVFYQRDTETGIVSESTSVWTDKPVAEAPPPPEIDYYGAYNVFLVYTPGYEYKMDDGEWQSSAKFKSDFSREHRYYQRVAESGANYVSESSEALVYKLDKLPARDIIVDNDMLEPVFLTEVIGCYYFYIESDYYDNNLEYQFSIDREEWKKYLYFGNLDPDTEYTIYVRRTPNAAYYPSEEKVFYTFRTKTLLNASKNSKTSPNLKMKSDTTVEIYDLVGVKDYILTDADGNTVKGWQSSCVFTDLSPDTEYMIFGRNQSTDYYMGGITKPLVFKTLKPGETYEPYEPGKITISDIGIVSLSGSKEPGDPIRVSFSNLSSSVDKSKLRYEWYRNGVKLEGVTRQTCTTTIDDLGCSFTVKVYYDELTEYIESCRYDVNDYILGDVNGDLKINLTDAAMTLKHIAKWNVDGFNEKTADYKRDGFVNLRDVSKMLQTIAGWKG
ncbi:MAG: hypothetical protein E7578_01825 [Ruminococcaceae bacterium]|nr:hypothetical protein [Oscillospiraceae bacterium]